MKALLPFEPHEYRGDFAPGEELDGFEAALAAADEIVALPGDRADLETAYVQVGESVVGSADLLIAIWDGELARGRGGTGEVVELALRTGVPVIHIKVSRSGTRIRLRALMDDDTWRPKAASPHDPELYDHVLRGAFKLGPGARRDGELNADIRPRGPERCSNVFVGGPETREMEDGK